MFPELPDDSVDSSDLVADLPGGLEAPPVLHGKVLPEIPELGEVIGALLAVEPPRGLRFLSLSHFPICLLLLLHIIERFICYCYCLGFISPNRLI